MQIIFVASDGSTEDASLAAGLGAPMVEPSGITMPGVCTLGLVGTGAVLVGAAEVFPDPHPASMITPAAQMPISRRDLVMVMDSWRADVGAYALWVETSEAKTTMLLS